jgi:hypothetical protein
VTPARQAFVDLVREFLDAEIKPTPKRLFERQSETGFMFVHRDRRYHGCEPGYQLKSYYQTLRIWELRAYGWVRNESGRWSLPRAG